MVYNWLNIVLKYEEWDRGKNILHFCDDQIVLNNVQKHNYFPETCIIIFMIDCVDKKQQKKE